MCPLWIGRRFGERRTTSSRISGRGSVSADSRKLPCIECLRGRSTTPTWEKSGRSMTPTFAMVPEAVLSDCGLTHRDIRVYALLACARRGQYVSVGARRLARGAQIDRRSVRQSISKLALCGHLEVVRPTRRGSRGRYRLTSSLFAVAKEPVPPANADTPMGRKELLEEVKCSRCRRNCKKLLKVGYCRSCRWEDKVKGISRSVAREEISRTVVDALTA